VSTAIATLSVESRCGAVAIGPVCLLRHSFVKARTTQANQIRSLLGEFGVVMPKGITNVSKRVPEVLENESGGLPAGFRHLMARLVDHFRELDRQVAELEAQIISLWPGLALWLPQAAGN
jgi:transposase